MPIENGIAKAILDGAFQVHRLLGPGLLESVYELALAHELRKRGLRVDRQVSIPSSTTVLPSKKGSGRICWLRTGSSWN